MAILPPRVPPAIIFLTASIIGGGRQVSHFLLTLYIEVQTKVAHLRWQFDSIIFYRPWCFAILLLILGYAWKSWNGQRRTELCSIGVPDDGPADPHRAGHKVGIIVFGVPGLHFNHELAVAIVLGNFHEAKVCKTRLKRAAVDHTRLKPRTQDANRGALARGRRPPTEPAQARVDNGSTARVIEVGKFRGIINRHDLGSVVALARDDIALVRHTMNLLGKFLHEAFDGLQRGQVVAPVSRAVGRDEHPVVLRVE